MSSKKTRPRHDKYQFAGDFSRNCRIDPGANIGKPLGMQVHQSSAPLVWGELDLPISGIQRDWYGQILSPPAVFALACDRENLWFIAGRQAPAMSHPAARSGEFVPELWKFDVAELFLADPASGRYLEFNLAPNSAWWATAFSSIRQPDTNQADFSSQIISHHEPEESGSWLASLVIPLDLLREEINFGKGTSGNIAFILNSPQQTFHSACPLRSEEPDFHRPSEFTLFHFA